MKLDTMKMVSKKQAPSLGMLRRTGHCRVRKGIFLSADKGRFKEFGSCMHRA